MASRKPKSHKGKALPARGPSAPADAIQRAAKFPNFHLHLAAPWERAREEGGRIVAEADLSVDQYLSSIAACLPDGGAGRRKRDDIR